MSPLAALLAFAALLAAVTAGTLPWVLFGVAVLVQGVASSVRAAREHQARLLQEQAVTSLRSAPMDPQGDD